MGCVGGAGKSVEARFVAQHLGGDLLEDRHEGLVRRNLGGRHHQLPHQFRRQVGLLGHGGGEEAVYVVDHLLLVHAGQGADVAGELGVARIDPVEHPGLGHYADVDGRSGGAERMGLVGQVALQVTVHPVDQPGHLDGGVDPLDAVRDGGVHLGAGDPHLEEGGAPRHQVDRLPLPLDAAGLPDERHIGIQQAVVRHPLGAEQRSRLLVRGEHRHQVSGEWSHGPDPGHRVDHGGHGGLHVARSEPDQVAVLQDRIPRVGLPGGQVSGRLGVQVPGEHQRGPAARSGNPDDEVGSLGGRTHPLHIGDPQVGQPGGDQIGHGPLVTGRVGRRGADQLPGELEHLVAAVAQVRAEAVLGAGPGHTGASVLSLHAAASRRTPSVIWSRSAASEMRT